MMYQIGNIPVQIVRSRRKTISLEIKKDCPGGVTCAKSDAEAGHCSIFERETKLAGRKLRKDGAVK